MSTGRPTALAFTELVVVEAHQAGLRHRRRQRVEAVEPATIRDEIWPLLLEDVPYRLVRPFRMGMHLGVGDTFVGQPGVQLIVGFDPKPRREETFPDQTDLVLDLTLLPTRGRRAGHRINQVMAAHLQEAAIILTVLADEDRLHRRLHVVVDATGAGTSKEGEGAFVRVEYHLLRLTRISPAEHHPAVAQADMRNLHGHRDAAHHNDLVAPIELVGFARRERQWNEGGRGLAGVLPAPGPCVTAHGVVATLVAQRPQFFEQPDQGQTLSRRGLGIRRQHPIEIGLPPSQPGPRLDLPLVRKRCLPERRILRTVLREIFRSRAISLIDLPLTRCSRRIRPIVSTTSIPRHPLETKRAAQQSRIQGVNFGRRSPGSGVKFARRNTSIDWERLLKAVRHHTDCPWVLLYIERWLKAPAQMEDGSVVPRTAGTPQGGVISPLLANLFLHYTFDAWMARAFAHIPFERYA